MRTYQVLYKNEIRAVEITINDEDGQPFLSDSASAAVYDEDNTVVVAEQAAYTLENKVYTIIGAVTTSNIGNYKIVWKVVKGSYRYYLVTNLIVQDLF